MTLFIPNILVALAAFAMTWYIEGKQATIGNVAHILALCYISLGIYLLSINIIDMLSGKTKISPMDDMDYLNDREDD